MQQYEEFLKQINKYFEYDEVTTQGSIISAYDLIKILESRLRKLYDLIYEKKDFIQMIESYYHEKNLLKIIMNKINKTVTPQVELILTRYENDHAYIYIRFSNNTCEKINYNTLEICKESGTNELYFGEFSGIDKDFVDYHRDVFLDRLVTIENFAEIFKLSVPNMKEIPGDVNVRETIDDDFLKLVITYDSYGDTRHNLSIVSSVDHDKIFERVWLDRPSLKKYVNEHEEEILKRIPINILDLKYSTQKIITDYYDKKNTNEHKLELK